MLLESQESVAGEESPPESTEQLLSPHEPEADEEGSAFSPTWDDIREKIQALALQREHYHGYPLPDDECKLVVHPRFPLQSMNGSWLGNDEVETDERPPGMDDATFSRLMALAFEFNEAKMVNCWRDDRRQRDVVIFEKESGKRFARTFEHGPGSRLDMVLRTIGVSRCWDYQAELTAMEKLITLVPLHLFRYYIMTGTFLERSNRSNVL